MSRNVAHLALLASVAIAAGPADAASDTAALIQRQSQAFSDASATGNAAVYRRLLDDRVVFIDESGNVATKKDLIAGAGPSPAGISQTLVQKNFKVELHGNVAVTSFTDSSTVHFHGQLLHADFLSTEVWLHEDGGWKMISSQTLAIPQDPPAIDLPADVLDDYVGTYSAGPGYTVAIAHSGPDLTASVNGGAPVVLKAEVKDVLFVPGQPRLRRIFVRDAAGKITGFVSRREGHDITLRRLP